ncbi:hypothetical protein GGI14_006283, partial [Coemansia sp. S680]
MSADKRGASESDSPAVSSVEIAESNTPNDDMEKAEGKDEFDKLAEAEAPATKTSRFKLFGGKKKKEAKEVIPLVPILQLFRFADTLDRILIAVGTVTACAAGVAMPLMTVIFAGITDTFLKFEFPNGELDQKSRDLLDSETRKNCWYFLALGLAMWLVSSVQKLTWAITSERMSKRLRENFYISILRQEIGWFDGLSTGELTTRISGDVNLMQEGTGEKFSFVLQYVTTFFTGIIIAFVKGWKLTLVVLSVLPVL